ncbi:MULTISPECIES: orotidine-5'-phosphate decarboxylase [Dermacoccus]|uniref:Orotidine-5'-phosphate decarboxylase n=2 Tax=Dermacoccus TaxID=57495 RepID=A0A417ZAG4_9MICO|nr:orotidine-5'-phosphate decarboxylase [Dermacoccus abyssi]RHW47628.1 orotidine-5'-phosphate decarboxylase [Dermacoccus abyssi]
MTTTSPEAGFGARLKAAHERFGPACVGIDPHRGLVEGWGLRYSYEGVERFALTCVEAFGGRVASVKPQSAFFEVFGSRGVALLERVTKELREAGTLVVLDVKRGDIGTTMTAYGEAFLGKEAPEPADAITLSPYLGYESLRPALDLARDTGRGVFVLALTSNPEGAGVQHASTPGGSVAGDIVAAATRDNAEAADRGEWGHVGFVMGATIGSALDDLGLRDALAASNAPILAPGFGAQGGTVETINEVFGASVERVIPTTSRDVLKAGPDVSSLIEAVERTRESVARLA